MTDNKNKKQTRLAGVMGWPISHSLSPKLHNYWFDKFEIDGVYVPLPVQVDDFRQALRALPKLGFSGVNVTVPHKVSAFTFVDETSEAARRMGAVNTILIEDSGWMVGLNTDGHGFLAHLIATIPDLELNKTASLIVGSGGAARAIASTLLSAGVPKLMLCNRTMAKAEKLALDLQGEGRGQIELLPFDCLESEIGEAQLVVNCTSLGMVGQPPLELPLENLTKTAVVYDIVYKPLESFEHWGGVTPEVNDDLRRLILDGL